MKSWIVFAAICCIGLPGCSVAKDEVEMTVHVIGEGGEAIPNAIVGIGFPGNTPGSGSGARVRTDSGGMASLSGNAQYGVKITVSKQGYYESRIGRYYGEPNTTRWTREIVLREVKNPIPMYAKIFKSIVPNTGEYIGFDLQRGQWVSPYGEGVKTDLEFRANRHVKSRNTYRAELDIRVPEGQGGIIKYDMKEKWKASEYRTPYLAPTDGYERQYTAVRSRTNNIPDNTNETNTALIVKVRGDESNEGSIENADYGKITDFILSAGLSGSNVEVKFTFYFNPNKDDRNLEYDPDQNLFSRLLFREQPRHP